MEAIRVLDGIQEVLEAKLRLRPSEERLHVAGAVLQHHVARGLARAAEFRLGVFGLGDEPRDPGSRKKSFAISKDQQIWGAKLQILGQKLVGESFANGN